jgi:chemotaxis protein MotB
MKKLILFSMVLFIVLSACKSQEGLPMGSDPYDSRLMDQDRIIGELLEQISSLDSQLQNLENENSMDVEQMNLLKSEREFLKGQLNRITGNYESLSQMVEDKQALMDQALLEIRSDLAEEIERGEVDIFTYNGMVILHIKNTILFQPNQADIREENKEVLMNIASIFKYFPDKIIRVEGHTATGPDTVQYPTSWELGAARAVNVTRYFQEQAGIEPQRLVAVSFGEWRPVSSNDTAENRAKNRRIEIVILNRPLYQWQELNLGE